MTQETRREQVPVHAEKPAPTGKTEHLKARADRKKAIIELTDADLQAVNGGGSKPGIGSGSNEQ